MFSIKNCTHTLLFLLFSSNLLNYLSLRFQIPKYFSWNILPRDIPWRSLCETEIQKTRNTEHSVDLPNSFRRIIWGTRPARAFTSSSPARFCLPWRARCCPPASGASWLGYLWSIWRRGPRGSSPSSAVTPSPPVHSHCPPHASCIANITWLEVVVPYCR